MYIYPYFFCVLFIQLLAWIPFSIFRWILVFYVTKLKTDRTEYGNLLETMETLFADDDYTNNVSNSSIVALLEINGDLTVDRLKRVVNKMLEIKEKDAVRYAKLQQYPENIMGYWFWRNEHDFKLEDHLQTLNVADLVSGENWNVETISKMHYKILNNKWPKLKSPWEIILLKNVSSLPHQVIYFILFGKFV